MLRLARAFGFALEGLRYVTRTQPNFRIHCTIAVVVLVLGVWLDVGPLGLAVIIAMIGLVLGLEAVNSALEAAIDVISPGRHPLAKNAKDAAAAGVLLAAIASIAVGLAVLGPPLLRRIG